MDGDERVDLTDESGAVVLSLEVARRLRHFAASRAKCDHKRTRIDPDEAEMACLDCGVRLNPTEWIIRLAEHWKHYRSLIDNAREEARRLETKRRVKCDCGKMIALHGLSADERRVRETRERRLSDALEQIRLLVPASAATYAAEIARKALAARDPSPAPYGQLTLVKSESDPGPTVNNQPRDA